MIRIIRGSKDAVRNRCLEIYHATEQGVWLEELPGRRRYWSSFRTLLPFFRDRLGATEVEDCLSRRKTVSALILGRLREQLSPTEHSELSQLGARLTSHLSHNWSVDRPVLNGLADTLGELSGKQPSVWIVPDLCAPDPTTLPLFLAVRFRSLQQSPGLVVGVVSDGEAETVDEQGLVWGYSSERQENLLLRLTSVEGSLEHETVDGWRQNAPAPRPTLDVLDDDLDGNAWNLLAGSSSFSGVDEDRVVLAIERCFQAFGRDVALQLGLALLGKRLTVSEDHRLLVAKVLSLCAHNWQFESSQGSERLTAFIETHLRDALARERDLESRLALLYRLAVTLGRRKKDFSAAQSVCDQAVAECQGAELPRRKKIYQEIWARNIRAYVHVKRQDYERAFLDSDACVELATELTTPIEASTIDERFTRTTVVDNNATLCKFAGREGELFARVEKNMVLLEEDPPSFGARFSAGGWMALYRRKYKLRQAIRAATYGLDDSGGTYRDFRWYYLSQLADLHFKRGDAARAFELLEETKAFRPHLRFVQHRAFLAPALAALRAGQLDGAERELSSCLLHREAEIPSVRAEILSALAIVHAERGDEEAAERAIERAIDSSLEEGNRDNMMRVAWAAAEIASRLGRESEALASHAQVLELAEIEGEATAPLGLRVCSHVALAQNGHPQTATLEPALRLLPNALLDDSDAWWALPKLVERLGSIEEADLARLAAAEPQGLEILLHAAEERDDCRDGLERLWARLPRDVVSESLAV